MSAGAPGLDEAWEQLLATAVLGTARSGEHPPALPEPLAGVAAAAGLHLTSGRPGDALAAAALLDSARRVARLGAAVDDVEPVAPAPGDDRPTARTSLATLDRLSNRDRDGLLEWLELLDERGLLVPHRALAALLVRAATDADLARRLRPVVGARGLWLLGHDDALAPLARRWGAGSAVAEQAQPGPDGAVDPADPVWRHGTLDARERWLRDARLRDPAAARAVLESSVRRLPAAERARLLGALTVRLGADDEPLLDAALDDRAAAVRSAAARLLARVPGSAFAERARRRAIGTLRVEGRWRRRLVVTAPDRFDAAAARDGLEEPAGASAVVAPAVHRLRQVLAAAPLDTWVPALADDPAALVALPVTDAHAGAADDTARITAVVHTAWAVATEREGDPAWALALVSGPTPTPPTLLDLVAPPARAAVVARLLRGSTDDCATAVTVLERWPRPLPGPLVDAAVGAVRRLPARADYQARHLARSLATVVARRADPTTVLDPGEDALLQNAAATLAERRQTYEETTA